MRIPVIALRNISRNRRRSLLSATAIAVASMAIVMLFSLLAGMKEDLAYNIQTFYTGEVRVRNVDYDRYEQLAPLHLRIESPGDVLAEIERADGVRVAAPRIGFPAVVYEQEETHGVLVLGVALAAEERYQGLSKSVAAGRLPRDGENEALIGRSLAEELGVGIGDRVTLLAQTMRRGSNALTVTVTGIAGFPVNAVDRLSVILPIDRARRLARIDDSLTEILIKLNRGTDSRRVSEELNRRLAAAGRTDLASRSWEDIPSSFTFVAMADRVYSFVALFFFILAGSVIVNTTMMVIFERTREIGTIGAMGMTGGQIVRLFFTEALYLGLIGALAGVVLGIGLTIPLSIYGIDFGAAMEGVDMEIGGSIYPRLTLRSTVSVFVYSVTIAALASLIPSIRAARIRPVEALRTN